ncbi:MAG: hypothetical protein A2104_03000 [Candidatus Melainabacteria bacterium GWF2_32_7]|nr:MAG: hypothetical protein A2104_03000 [Candidatus Melainabacteria bacterium GWF2_32_7]
MVKFMNKNRIILTLSLATLLINFSNLAMASDVADVHDKKHISTESLVTPSEKTQVANLTEKPKVIQAPKSQTTIKVSNPRTDTAVKINYKIFTNKETKTDYAAIYINNKEVVRYNHPAGGFSPEDRAKILVHRLQQFILKNGNPKDIIPGKENNCSIGRAGNTIFFTVDEKNAGAIGLSTSGLSIHWVNNIREALGAPKIVRGNSFIASRGNISATFARKYLGKEEVGVASWYGGVFHGKKAANGSVYNKHEFTAAHKTLPFGTLVKVTNLNNNKSCIVKITDRGPFVQGRIIDLSRAAAKETGIIQSGVSRVKIEVIGKI